MRGAALGLSLELVAAARITPNGTHTADTGTLVHNNFEEKKVMEGAGVSNHTYHAFSKKKPVICPESLCRFVYRKQRSILYIFSNNHIQRTLTCK